MTTRWLDEEEQAAWRAYMHATRLLFAQLERELQSAHGMPHGYYEILVHLSEAPGHTLRMSELADRTLSSRSRLSHAVARLEAAGWVVRRECPSDRRGALAELTENGMKALEAAAPTHVEGVRTHVFDQLGPGQAEELRRIGEAMIAHLQGLFEGDEGACPGGGTAAPTSTARE